MSSKQEKPKRKPTVVKLKKRKIKMEFALILTNVDLTCISTKN